MDIKILPISGSVSTLYYDEVDTRFGGLIVVFDSDSAVYCASFHDNRPNEVVAQLRNRFSSCSLVKSSAPSLIEDAFSHFPEIESTLYVRISGTPFQKDIWAKLVMLPIGETVTYSQISKEIGRSNSCRAVGKAIGSNPVALLIPCHRVIRRDGSLSGYRWGVERKRAVLEYEACIAESKFGC